MSVVQPFSWKGSGPIWTLNIATKHPLKEEGERESLPSRCFQVRDTCFAKPNEGWETSGIHPDSMNKPERDWWKLKMLHGYRLKFLTQLCVHCRLTVVRREAVSALQQCPSPSHCCCWPPCAIKNDLFLQMWPFSLKYFFWLSDIFLWRHVWKIVL